MEKTQEDGSIIQPTNFKKPNYVCCCCDLLTNLKKIKKPWEFIYSNYFAKVDSNLCVGCGSCLDRCQMEAIKIDGIASIDHKRCIGCGNCIVTCPENAISLIKKKLEIIPPETIKELYMQSMKKSAEIRSKHKIKK